MIPSSKQSGAADGTESWNTAMGIWRIHSVHVLDITVEEAERERLKSVETKTGGTDQWDEDSCNNNNNNREVLVQILTAAGRFISAGWRTFFMPPSFHETLHLLVVQPSKDTRHSQSVWADPSPLSLTPDFNQVNTLNLCCIQLHMYSDPFIFSVILRWLGQRLNGLVLLEQRGLIDWSEWDRGNNWTGYTGREQLNGVFIAGLRINGLVLEG